MIPRIFFKWPAGSFCHGCIWGWRGGVSFKPGSARGGLSRMEWRSCWTRGMTQANSHAPGSDCPISAFLGPKTDGGPTHVGAQTCGLGHSGPLPRAFPLPSSARPGAYCHLAYWWMSWLTVTPYRIVTRCWKSLLCSCSVHRPYWKHDCGSVLLCCQGPLILACFRAYISILSSNALN